MARSNKRMGFGRSAQMLLGLGRWAVRLVREMVRGGVRKRSPIPTFPKVRPVSSSSLDNSSSSSSTSSPGVSSSSLEDSSSSLEASKEVDLVTGRFLAGSLGAQMWCPMESLIVVFSNSFLFLLAGT